MISAIVSVWGGSALASPVTLDHMDLFVRLERRAFELNVAEIRASLTAAVAPGNQNAQFCAQATARFLHAATVQKRDLEVLELARAVTDPEDELHVLRFVSKEIGRHLESISGGRGDLERSDRACTLDPTYAARRKAVYDLAGDVERAYRELLPTVAAPVLMDLFGSAPDQRAE